MGRTVPHRAGAPVLRGGRHPQRCRLAGLCEGWAGVRAFWPAVSPGCRGDVLPCPCCNSCCPGGCRALWPAHRRPLPAFQGAVVLWTPAAEGGWRGLLQEALTQRRPARWVPPAVGRFGRFGIAASTPPGGWRIPVSPAGRQLYPGQPLHDWLWRRRGGDLLPATLYQRAGNGFFHLFAPVSAPGSGVFAARLPLVPEGAMLASLVRRRPLDAAPPLAK